MDDEQRERFREAVDRKSADAKAASEQTKHEPPPRAEGEMDDQESLYHPKTPQDVTDPRGKNEGHGKKTADKWNQ